MLGSRTRKQAGDTIVEVLIVLAVLGSAIGIAYATANRSLLNARQAQESSRASVIAQSQVEQLRALASNSDISVVGADHYIYNATLPFCVDTGGLVVNFASPTVYPNACKYDRTASFEYDVSIKYDNSLGDDSFTVQVLYDDVLGQGQDSVTLQYRAHTP